MIKTLLLSKEVDDNDIDLLVQPESFFTKLSQRELEGCYTVLRKMLKPVFSGSVDHRINLLDAKKVKQVLKASNWTTSIEDIRIMNEF